MKTSDLHPKKFMKSENLKEMMDGNKPATFSISKVCIEELTEEGVKKKKPILYLKGVEMGIVLNLTNTKMIEKQHGDDTDDWIGKKISLSVIMVEFRGDLVPAIRVL